MAIAPIAVVSLLIANPAPAQNKIHSEATTRLFETIEENNLRGVKINAIGGGDLEAVNSQGLTPIALAIEKGHFDIVFYLLAYRDMKTAAKAKREKFRRATNIPLAAPPAPQPIPLAAPTTEAIPEVPPLPAAGVSRDTATSAVASVYKPPPGSDPWSATVVTSDPPPPLLDPIPVPEGPSPFDAGTRAPGSGLTIIGEIRSLNEPEEEAPPDEAPETEAFETVVITAPPTAEQITEIAPSVVADPDPVVVAVDPVQTAALAVPPIPDPDPAPPVEKLVATAPDDQAVSPEAKPEKTSDIAEAAPQEVETIEPVPAETQPSPLFDAPGETPAPAPAAIVQASAIVEPEPRVEAVSTTRIKQQPAPQVQIQQTPPPDRPLIAIETTLPGKQKSSRGFFSKILSVLSFGDDDEDTTQIARNRVVQPMPPELTADQRAAASGQGDTGWAVRKIEKAALASYPKDAPGAVRNRSGQPLATLQDVNLSLLENRRLGLSPPKANSSEFQKSCIEKKSGAVAFCIVGLKWPLEVAGLFAASTVLYEGTKAIVRYDEGAATYYHTLFPSRSFGAIVDYFTARYGPPSKIIERSIAPLAAPRIANPTAIWHSIAPVTKLLTTLEIRTFDDARGGFPDTQRGVALLYHEWSRPVFPHVSAVELMMLSAN